MPNKILVVEDDENLARILQINLDSEGYEAVFAYDGEEALTRIKEETPDLILLDIMLPKIDGFEFIKRVRQDNTTRHIPVLILSAKASDQDLVRGWEVGAQDYFVKPFNLTKLMEAIGRVLAKPASKEQKIKEEMRGAARGAKEVTHIALVTGGRDGEEVLRFFLGDPKIKIEGMADKDPDSDGLKLAARLGIHTTANLAEITALPNLDLIVATAHAGALSLLQRDEFVEIVGQNSLRFLMSFIAERENREERERLLAQQLSNKVQELSTLGRITGLLTSSLDLNKVLQKIVDIVLHTMHASGCSIVLMNTEDRSLSLAADNGVTEGYTRDILTNTERSFAEHVLTRAIPVLVTDMSTDERFGFQEFGKREGLRSVFAIPLILKNRVTGVLLTYMSAPNPFTNDEKRFLCTVADQAAIAIENARAYEQVKKLYRCCLSLLAEAVDARAQAPPAHSTSVGQLAGQLARRLGLEERKVEAVEKAGYLHDVGKLRIEHEALLSFPGAAGQGQDSPDRHPELGAKMAHDMGEFEDVIPCIRHHHERWDGSGWPDHLKGTAIPVGARILAVSNAFSHMIHSLRFKPEEALGTIEERAGSHFDPTVVSALKEYLTAGTPTHPSGATPSAGALRGYADPESA
ncbi:MAG: response regulator [Armatimonadetes bacterium]|nr:response regulator [Armatimonadota bacterium]